MVTGAGKSVMSHGRLQGARSNLATYFTGTTYHLNWYSHCDISHHTRARQHLYSAKMVERSECARTELHFIMLEGHKVKSIRESIRRKTEIKKIEY